MGQISSYDLPQMKYPKMYILTVIVQVQHSVFPFFLNVSLF